MTGNNIATRAFLALLGLCFTATSPAQTDAVAPVATMAERIVENFRRTIVLHESTAIVERRRHVRAGQYIFFRTRELAGQLVDSLAAPGAARTANIDAFLDLLATRADWRDIDRLALSGFISEVSLRLPADDAMLGRLRLAAAEIARIRVLYNREITATLAEHPRAEHFLAGPSTLPTVPHRPEWRTYVEFVRTRYPDTALLEEMQAVLAEAVFARLSASIK